MNTSTKKILINCLSARSGGSLNYLRNAVGNILTHGNQSESLNITAICDRNQAEHINADKQSVLLTETRDMGGLQRNIWERKHVSKLVREKGFDTLFTPYQVSAVRSKAKSVLMLRNMEPFFFGRYQYSNRNAFRNRLLQYTTRRSTTRADWVIAVSEFARQYLVEQLGLPENRVIRIYHGRDPYFSMTDDDATCDSLLAANGVHRPFLLTCGSLLPYRRCEDVLEAFFRFCESGNREFDLVVAGEGTDQRYRDMLNTQTSRSPFKNQVRFVGHVDQRYLRTLYRQAQLVILATEIEACPNIAIESMAAGAAIVASNSDPLPEILGPDNASFFEKRNTRQLARLVGQLLESPKRVSELRQRARQRAEDFCWKRCSDLTLQLLNQI